MIKVAFFFSFLMMVEGTLPGNKLIYSKTGLLKSITWLKSVVDLFRKTKKENRISLIATVKA